MWLEQPEVFTIDGLKPPLLRVFSGRIAIHLKKKKKKNRDKGAKRLGRTTRDEGARRLGRTRRDEGAKRLGKTSGGGRSKEVGRNQRKGQGTGTKFVSSSSQAVPVGMNKPQQSVWVGSLSRLSNLISASCGME